MADRNPAYAMNSAHHANPAEQRPPAKENDMSEQPTHTPQPGQWQPTNPPAPPVKKKGWVLRHPILAVGIGLISMFGFQAALNGGGDDATTAAPTTTSSPAAAAGATTPAKPAVAPEPKVDPDDVGNEANPVTIVEGKAFDIRKLAYAAGWKVTSSDFGMELKNLKVTNNRDDRDGPFVEIKFMKGSEVLASIDCTSDQILPGQTATLNCFGTEPKPKGYDRITINDTF
ncbi:hypothetical protein [Janibacter sp. HTCC2649]|uniref:hypothetical protein n=1 Tax=Janibacter sp. HTCC2649 TaxID=313589 RepID=UPI0002D85204|nr:hypothetical protein [Janibacter sp. HTCC2649]